MLIRRNKISKSDKAGIRSIKGYAGMTTRSNRVNHRGFTLIEILVVIVIAGILLPVIVVPFVTGIRRSE